VLLRDQVSTDAFDVRFGFTLTELAFATILVAVVDRPALALARPRLVYLTALCSYSIYLTHTLGIHVALGVAGRLRGAPPALTHLLALLCIVAGGALFYRLVESQALKLRDVLARKRELGKPTGPTLSSTPATPPTP
jgi:peptidoglycan/LPS O-acetylase OafA/YrhL